jgi:protein phosphatase 1L
MSIKYNIMINTFLCCMFCANSSKGMSSHRESNPLKALNAAIQEISIQGPQQLSLEAGVYQDNKRKGQDRYEIREDDKYYIGAVYDGHGPADDVVNYVRENLIEYILAYTRNGSSMLDAIKNAFTQTECEINDLKLEGGSTALIAILDKDTRKIYIANSGDCRAVLSRNNNPFILSFDHKPTRSDEKQRIEEKGGYVEFDGVPRINGLAISRSFGDLDLKKITPGCIIAEPEIVEDSLKPEDQFLILASDGIWDVINNKEAVATVHDAFELDAIPCNIARGLVVKAKTYYSRDDLTAVIIRFHHN